MILHICTKNSWEESKKTGSYEADSLKSQGYIHCSTPDQVIEVADYVFKGKADLLLLVIDENLVDKEIKYEDAGDGTLYPHIYGPINLNAVVNTVDFPMKEGGNFELPASLGQSFRRG